MTEQRYDGTVFLASLDDTEEIMTREEITLDVDHVALRIGSVSPKITRHEVIETRDPAAVRYQHDVMAARRKLQRRYGPARPVPKPTGGKRSRRAHPPCLGCGGTGFVVSDDGEWQPCPVCG